MCILPGLEENNEFIQKEIQHTLSLIRDAIGTKYFIGCMWLTIMRLTRGRAASI
jgi:hypothetical protein